MGKKKKKRFLFCMYTYTYLYNPDFLNFNFILMVGLFYSGVIDVVGIYKYNLQ